MFIKSALKVFTGIFGQIFRVFLIIIFIGLGAWCIGYLLTMPFLWGGLLRLGGAAVCALIVRFLILLGREKDDVPPEDDFRTN